MANYDKCEVRNGAHLYRSETLVYEDEEWGIITDSDLEGDSEGNTYATHRCLNAATDDGYIGYGEYCWIDKSKNISSQEVCSRCNENVPDSVVTLVRLHNWGK